MQQLIKPLLFSVLLCLISSGSIAQSCGQSSSTKPSDDDAIARAFATGASDIQVEGEGTVIRLLADDLNGSRHQRFIIQLSSGQTTRIG